MDFKDLLLIAEGNSSLSKRKIERQSIHPRVSTSAVANFLAKRNRETETAKAQEDAARKRRILARLESQNKRKMEKQKPGASKHEEQANQRPPQSSKMKEKNAANQKLKNLEKQKEMSSKKLNEREKSHRKSKETIGKKSKPLHSKNNLSFDQLAMMAKNNSATASVDKLKSSKRPLSSNVSVFDPDRDVRVKIQHVSKQQSVAKPNTPVRSVKKSANNNCNVKHKVKTKPASIVSNKTNAAPVKRGLIAETISNTKNGAKEIARKVKAVPRGIAAQNKNSTSRSSVKRTVQDYENDFENEERRLARKRKLFEMRRVTGNHALQEDDLYDYDYDDEEGSEDDDFIDDTGDAADVSKHIKSIFGYDRNRYSDSDDDDLKNMDSSYSQIEKEEARSARIARIEDEYEAMKEEEEKRKAAKRKKK